MTSLWYEEQNTSCHYFSLLFYIPIMLYIFSSCEYWTVKKLIPSYYISFYFKSDPFSIILDNRKASDFCIFFYSVNWIFNEIFSWLALSFLSIGIYYFQWIELLLSSFYTFYYLPWLILLAYISNTTCHDSVKSGYACYPSFGSPDSFFTLFPLCPLPLEWQVSGLYAL